MTSDSQTIVGMDTSAPTTGNNDPQEQTAPTPKLFEIRPSQGKGLGIFAVRNLERGTRLLAEAPLIIVTAQGVRSPEGFRTAILTEFLKLNAEQQGAFWKLAASPKRLSEAKEFISMLPSVNDDHWSTEAKASSERPVSPFAPLSRDEQSKIIAIGRTNIFGLDGTLDGVCNEASRFNHSCTPNADYTWNPALKKLTVHTVRKISAGDEITLTYVPVLESRAARRDALEPYGFECDCDVCTADARLWMLSDERRQKIYDIMQSFMHWKAMSKEDEDITEPTLDQKRLLEEAVDLVEYERLEGKTLGIIYFLSFKEGHGDELHLQHLLEAQQMYQGDDHPDTQKTKKELSEIEHPFHHITD
ncbi:uncharacterized protein K452DRAFT_299354 [Aplosporella prunicola CBS 121167]|uniref:SET domain-containing protein n=1 Tax=Aplosporella prunicola CBS 121167 TaxID=1176127 RepID=A0A6A6B8Q6_9PEZI|nr:uncharacterized protein K452DRAFT_299354 [Aplosporella prunicola CBS 121167]KAF2140622.1 hypothetical protein K452DRAFT_299354 [Aplosporella prunicola CBS 121167]